MKKILSAFAFAALIGLSAAHAEIATGKAAPDHTFTDIKGVEHSINGFKGKTVVLEWHNPGCPFVKKFYDANAMQKTQSTALTDKDVVWVAVNSSAEGKEGYFASDKEAQAWLDKSGFKGTAYVRDASGELGRLYGAKTTPHMFVINKDGVLAYQGAIDSIKSVDAGDIAKADNYVLKALDAVKAGNTPKVTSTEPYGCGVKYKK